MRVDANISNFNPPPLCKLSDILSKLKDADKRKAIIFVSNLVYVGGREGGTPGWTMWFRNINPDGGLFVDLLEGNFNCWEKEVDTEHTFGRLIQPGEIFNIHYHGEVLTPPC